MLDRIPEAREPVSSVQSAANRRIDSRPNRDSADAGAEPLPPQLSVVIPFFNEAGNATPLIEEIEQALAARLRIEIVAVDDGSSDGTLEELRQLEALHDRLRVVEHETNRGQSAAIHSGVSAAGAPIIAVLDGDGQNDPADIPAMFGRLNCAEGVRMVVGERRNRSDTMIRRLSSRVANYVRSRTLNDGIRDTGCGLKVFYRDDFLRLPAFDHMHRFLPALVQRDGGKICSTPVNHRPRTRGRSKYGVNNRLWVGITDMIGVLWLMKRGFK
jgi:dolichol-phosphate mannosyltransferase